MEVLRSKGLRTAIEIELFQMSFMTNHRGFFDEKAYTEIANVMGSHHKKSNLRPHTAEMLKYFYGYNEEQMHAYHEGYLTGHPNAPHLFSDNQRLEETVVMIDFDRGDDRNTDCNMSRRYKP